MVDVSIIIVNYNTRALLRDCLASVVAETKGVQYEIFVVDNASMDGSREMLEREFPSVRRIFNEDNRGFAAANNQAIKIAEGRYVLLLNSDTKVLDGAVQKTMAFMENSRDASVVGCKLLNGDGSLQRSCLSFPSEWNLFSESFFLYLVFPRTQLFGDYHMTSFNYDSVRSVDVVAGAFMMIRRVVFETVGSFDEAYFMYTEETDLCFRVKAAGFQVVFYPSASIIHYGGGSVVNTDRFFEQFNTTLLYFVRKNFTGVNKSVIVFLKVAGIAVRVPVYAMAGLLTFNTVWFKKSRACAKVLAKVVR
jgi:GT2 family glycosyltransferase